MSSVHLDLKIPVIRTRKGSLLRRMNLNTWLCFVYQRLKAIWTISPKNSTKIKKAQTNNAQNVGPARTFVPIYYPCFQLYMYYVITKSRSFSWKTPSVDCRLRVYISLKEWRSEYFQLWRQSMDSIPPSFLLFFTWSSELAHLYLLELMLSFHCSLQI